VLIYVITAGLATLTFLLSGAGQLYAFLGVVVGSGIVLFLLTGRQSVQEDLEADSYDDAPDRLQASGNPDLAGRPDRTG
jgi:hypothetical protein